MSIVYCHSHTDGGSNTRLTDCTVKVDKLIDRAVELKSLGVAITDHESVSMHIQAIQKVKKLREENKIDDNWKLILGNEIYLVDDQYCIKDNYISGETKFHHFILLARDKEGHRQIRELSSKAWDNLYFTGKMERVPTGRSDLERVIKGNHVIGATACLGGEIPQLILKLLTAEQNNKIKEIENIKWEINNFIQWCINVFGKDYFFIEIQPSDVIEQIEFNKKAIEIAKAYNLKWIATTDTHYIKKEDRKVHAAYLNSKEEDREVDSFYSSTYMQSIEEIKEYLSYLNEEDVNIAINNTLLIGEMVENYDFKSDVIVPRIPLPEFQIEHIFEQVYDKYPYIKNFAYSDEEQDRYLFKLIEDGFKSKIWNEVLSKEYFYEVLDRINIELKELWEITSVVNTKLSSYYVTTRKIINIMWEEGDSLVGVARGCFVPDSKILMNSHIVKNIQDVNIGDKVVTHKGNIKKVTNVLEYKADETMYKIKAGGFDEIISTFNHEFFATKVFPCVAPGNKNKWCILKCPRTNTCQYKKEFKPNWTSAVELKVGDYLTYPKSKMLSNSIFTLDLATLDDSLHYDDKYIWYEIGTNQIQTEKLNRFIKFDEEFARLAGYFIGNGYAECNSDPSKRYYRFEISFNANKKSNIKDCETLIKKIFNCDDINYTYNDNKTCIRINKNIKILGLLFKSYFGENAINKHIPNELLIDDEKIIRNLIIGLINTDGSVSFNNRFTYSTTSINLFYQFKYILSYLGFYLGATRRKHKKNNWLDEIQGSISGTQFKNFIEMFDINIPMKSIKFTCNQFIEDENYFYIRINNIEKIDYKGKVYDLSVEDDISYTVNGFGVHNSVTGFLICYLIDITQINPLQWDLPHWRHLTSSRPEIPDVDIDTAANRRKQILKALQNYFGEDRVLNICTFGTEGSRSAILTACRGLNIDNDIAQYISDMIPFERGSNWSITDCIEGDEEKNRKPIKEFIKEIESYENLLEVALGIEGLVNKRSIHASGVFIYNDNFVNFNARMKAPSGQYISQWNMNDSEYCGNLKVDLLTIEALDKIRTALDLLVEDGYMEWQGSLKETYNKYIHPDVLDYDTPEMWKMIGDNTIVDLFQFDTEVGLQAAQKVKPTNMFEMAVVNSLMRLMGDNNIQPVDQYVKFKNNINAWYKEMRFHKLNEDEISVLEKHLKKIYGVADTQEVVMQLSMDEKIAGFDLKQSNKLRKGISKKKGKIIDEAKEEFFNSGRKIGTSENLLNYVWNVQIKRQLGYSFSLNHTVPYSCIGLQEMNLAYHYPKLYWETACLTVNAGADVDSEDNKSSNYGKIASSIGHMQQRGVKIALPDINKADFGFKADIENNQIIFGLKGINGIGDDVVKSIITNRPYNSFQDFMGRMVLCDESPVKNAQLIQLIKAGCFEQLESKSRTELMKYYLNQVYEPKKELGLRNINNVVEANIIPEDMQIYFRYYNFKNYIAQNEFLHGIVPSKKPTKKGHSDRLIKLDEIAYPFYQENFSEDNIVEYVDNTIVISENKFKKEYDKIMESFKIWISQEKVLKEYNKYLYNEMWVKHAEGTISKWEMDSLCFYYSGHELNHINKEKYNIVNFFEMPTEPRVVDTYTRKGIERPKYEIVRIIGTVLDKNKHKHTIALLTVDGVVNVKYYDGAFYHYDRQISEKNEEGKKTILEKSWYTRGNILLLSGFRRGNQFRPYKYKDTIYNHTTTMIEGITLDGDLILRTERIQTNE